MPPAAAPTPVLDRLRPDEHARVLRELLRGHPELRLGAEQAATALLRQASADEVAGRVVIALGEFGLDDLAARSGRVPGGYVEPTEAACELVLDALVPIEAELRRCLELDLHAAARQTLLGLLAGLHRCCAPRDGTVLACAGPDVPVEHAVWLVDEARSVGLELDADDLEDRCPGGQLTATGLCTA